MNSSIDQSHKGLLSNDQTLGQLSHSGTNATNSPDFLKNAKYKQDSKSVINATTKSLDKRKKQRSFASFNLQNMSLSRRQKQQKSIVSIDSKVLESQQDLNNYQNNGMIKGSKLIPKIMQQIQLQNSSGHKSPEMIKHISRLQIEEILHNNHSSRNKHKNGIEISGAGGSVSVNNNQQQINPYLQFNSFSNNGRNNLNDEDEFYEDHDYQGGGTLTIQMKPRF
eukprot:403333312